MIVTVPPVNVQAVDGNGRPTREYNTFFRALASGLIAADGINLDDVNDRLDRIEAEIADSTTGNIQGADSIQTQGILPGYVYVTLQGDVEQTPALSFYGAITAGERGWQTYSANFAALDNGDGTASLDLADLPDSGTGAALVKLTRDAKGRIAGTEAATTTDLTEGANLYFTTARAAAAAPVQSVAGKTGAVVLAKGNVGLSNVDNTSDANKPVSAAQQTAMDALSFKNRLINGDFAINQRAFAGGSLAAGVYGFDRWKAGTGGCNVSLSGGVLTHTSGPLVQVMEAPGLASTTVTVSVEDPSGSISVDVDGIIGTIASGAGRRGVSIAVPSGSIGNVTLTLTATGVTYKRVQLEVGSAATKWDQRFSGTELSMCFRYYWRGVPNGSGINTNTYTTNAFQSFIIKFPVRMRTIPAASGTGIAVGTPFNPTYNGVGYTLSASTDGCRLLGNSNAAGTNANFGWDSNAVTSYFEMDAEL